MFCVGMGFGETPDDHWKLGADESNLQVRFQVTIHQYCRQVALEME